ncbi:MAG: LysR family transcriptional regulator [Rhodobacteraceae bacterium PARR1]|nr:MAG: LysR family transcriptional regulator [Rhodobacteraceae bacterium PARR1]
MTTDWRALPPLSALRAFVAVAEHGSLSQAARVLNVTHPAIAQQVRTLEEMLGLRLVSRQGRGMALTPEGARLAAALSDGFATIASAVADLRADQADRPVRVSLTAGFAAQWLMPRLRDFWNRHPDIGVSLHPDPRLVDLRAEGVDLAIRYGDGKWPGLEATFLASARLAVAASPDMVQGATLTTAELAAADWVLARDWPEQDNYLRSLGLDAERLSRTDMTTEELAIAAARQGLGLVVESLALLEDDVAAGRLIVVHDSRDRLPAYFLVRAPGRLSPSARAFADWLLDAA